MNKTVYLVAAASALLSLAGCQLNKQTPDYSKIYANAIVTVKHTPEDVFYLQLDDKTTVKPSNMDESPFGDKQVRALANLTVSDEKPEQGNSSIAFDKTAVVNWIDNVRTKDIVPSLGSEAEDDHEYGDAPIDIIGNWVTILEDGYLTLAFCAYWGNPAAVHAVNLVSGVDPEDPYTLEFKHNAFDDNWYYNPITATGIVAFDLSSLPPTNGETVELKIKYKPIYGSESVAKFKYCTGKTTETGAVPDPAKLTKSLNIL